MTKGTETAFPESTPDGVSIGERPRDWFVAAIESDGSVSQSLQAVLTELARRADFVAGLKSNLEMTGARGVDAITDLGQKIRGLENTLRFRLGILRPERPQAWFRAPAATNGGPFAAAVLEEPVFSPYEAHDAARVKAGLEQAWGERRATALPFKDQSPCLWRTLLGYAALLEKICELPAPFAGLRLDTLPSSLPQDLESRALRAFLINVRGEVLSVRDKLTSCYQLLLETSDKFWSAQIEQEASKLREEARRARANPRVDTMREEFKRRRSRPEVRHLLTPQDMDALRFMGFEDLPTAGDLRQRYLSMAKRLHPDLHGGNDVGFKTLSRAYEHLTARLP